MIFGVSNRIGILWEKLKCEHKGTTEEDIREGMSETKSV